MAKINLLPWRQAYREQKKREFIGIVIGVLIVAGLSAYAWIASVESQIDNQNARNRLLDQEIAKLDAQVKEISELKKVRDDLLARIKVIQDLEGTRPVIVRYFDEFARAVPDGVYITYLERKGNVMTVQGVAESYNRVASFMRNLDSSDWYAAQNLTSVTAAPEEGVMTVQTSSPDDLNTDKTEGSGQKSKIQKAGAKK